MFTFAARSTFCSTADEAAAKVAKYLPAGYSVGGEAELVSERHMLWDVPVVRDVPGEPSKAERNDVWVRLSSYGISPGDELKAGWQKVAGVGC